MIPEVSPRIQPDSSPEGARTASDADPSPDAKSLATLGSATGGLAAAAAAFVAALCCVGPSTVAVLGAGGALAAASIKPYRPYLLLTSLAMILYGFWRTYGGDFGNARARACPTKFGRYIRSALWVAAIVWAGGLILFMAQI